MYSFNYHNTEQGHVCGYRSGGGGAYTFTPSAVFSFLLLLLTQGLRWIVASTVDRALVTFLPRWAPRTDGRPWSGPMFTESFGDSALNWRSVISSNPLQCSLSVKWHTELISGQKNPLWDIWLQHGSRVSSFFSCLCAFAVLPAVDFPACCYV